MVVTQQKSAGTLLDPPPRGLWRWRFRAKREETGRKEEEKKEGRGTDQIEDRVVDGEGGLDSSEQQRRRTQ